MSGFQRHRRSGRVIATFTGFEADLLRSLTSQLVELLRNEAAVPDDTRDAFEALMDFSGPTSEPEDPVLARLFPSAYRDDDEAASEFRRFTEGSLRDGPWSYRIGSLVLVSPIYATVLIFTGTVAGRHMYFAMMGRKILGRFLPRKLGQKIGCEPARIKEELSRELSRGIKPKR